MIDIELLKTLYFIHAPSGFEDGIQGFIRCELNKIGIKFYTDNLNQIFNFDHENKPLVVAHSDQVKYEPLSKIIDKKGIIKGNSNLGADDKNGIWILLHLLKEYPNLNFCFSTEEEIGGNIQDLLYLEQDKLEKIPYCLVFDRKGKSDIVGCQNDYCSMEFQNDINDIGVFYGFKSARGLWSDCDHIADYLNCINISCGYYNAHMVNEYTVKKELINSLEFGKAILDNITKHYELDLTYHNEYKTTDYDFDDYYCKTCKNELLDCDFEEGFCPFCGELIESIYDVYYDNDKDIYTNE